MRRLSVLLISMVLASFSFADLPDFTDLVEQASPAVVNISTVQHNRGRLQGQFDGQQEMPEIFRRFFNVPGAPGYRGAPNQQQDQERTSLGSGFIVSKDGYVLTNNHVVDGADEIYVRLNDRRELSAELVGADATTDLALLRVKANNLPVVSIGDSDKLRVGEWVLAIGSPFGFDYSVTKGIVSAKGRSLPNENYVPFIQTDVAINPGNSGGPLFNLDGKVVGINSQIYTRSGGFMGLSFAIPINVAMEVVNQLKQDGHVSRGWLGVVIQEVDKELAESFGLKKAQGALVSQVVPNGPAAVAGIQAGDIISAFDGKEVVGSADLPHLVGRSKVGEKVNVDVIRHGKAKTLSIKIGLLPDDDARAVPTSSKGKSQQNRLGIEVSEIPSEQQQQWDVQGVLVTGVSQGAGANAGLVTGDVISMIYGENITGVQDFEKVVAKLPAGRSVPMRIIRRGAAMFIPLRIQG
ncbi:MAG: DegQ family serine endoprotease [Oceanospirillaceae bacterium]|nr:DegQ family serine endoprotease [Oceanospirillaceae bacterium]